jgi:hypothetical protein
MQPQYGNTSQPVRESLTTKWKTCSVHNMSKHHAVKVYRGAEEKLPCCVRNSPGTVWVRSHVIPTARLDVATKLYLHWELKAGRPACSQSRDRLLDGRHLFNFVIYRELQTAGLQPTRCNSYKYKYEMFIVT